MPASAAGWRICVQTARALETNANLVALRTAERWNGVLPQNIYAGAPIPFLSLPNTPRP